MKFKDMNEGHFADVIEALKMANIKHWANSNRTQIVTDGQTFFNEEDLHDYIILKQSVRGTK